MKRVRVTQRIQAPREAAWALITRHEGLPAWSPLKSVRLDPPGAPDRDGVGAVRHMSGAGPTLVEEVVEWRPPESYSYVLHRGAPIRDHRGTVTFAEDGEWTTVTWDVRFRPQVPGIGWLVAGVLGLALRHMLRRAKGLLESQA